MEQSDMRIDKTECVSKQGKEERTVKVKNR
jgi:hypothetical protein